MHTLLFKKQSTQIREVNLMFIFFLPAQSSMIFIFNSFVSFSVFGSAFITMCEMLKSPTQVESCQL